MKRIFSTFLVIAVLVTALAAPASAATYTHVTNDYNHMYSYIEPVNDGNGTITFEYIYSIEEPQVKTSMVVPDGATGRVVAFIAHYGLEGRSDVATTTNDAIVDGVLSCGTRLRTYRFASRTNHTVLRTVNGATNNWDYSWNGPHHYENIE